MNLPAAPISLTPKPYGPYVSDDREIDWGRLVGLRDAFLAGEAGTADYWEDEGLLADYDDTFGRRIGWKWDWVIADLHRRGWTPPPGQVVDWGCGPGVALRSYASAFPVQEVLLHDRSSRAVRFASSALAKQVPGVKFLSQTEAPAVFLASHVLTELDEAGLDQLLDRMGAAQSIIWVEPGTSDISLRFIPARQRLMDKGFRVVAPCTHQSACPLLQAGNARHWCHHFATPPPEIFLDGFWAYFSRAMGVDLRSLPLSYLVLDRRTEETTAPLPPDAVRLIGRQRVLKPYAQVLGCDAAGLHDVELTKRFHPALYRRMRHHEPFSLAQWQLDHEKGRVLEFEPCP